jgi:hypothetical protein
LGPAHLSAVATGKELIPPSSDIRVLFAFHPRRAAILLIGGDKSGAPYAQDP